MWCFKFLLVIQSSVYFVFGLDGDNLQSVCCVVIEWTEIQKCVLTLHCSVSGVCFMGHLYVRIYLLLLWADVVSSYPCSFCILQWIFLSLEATPQLSVPVVSRTQTHTDTDSFPFPAHSRQHLVWTILGTNFNSGHSSGTPRSYNTWIMH